MSIHKTALTPPKDFAERSSLYQEFLAEREEILRHKWIESEKKGQRHRIRTRPTRLDSKAPRELAQRAIAQKKINFQKPQ